MMTANTESLILAFAAGLGLGGFFAEYLSFAEVKRLREKAETLEHALRLVRREEPRRPYED